MSDLDQTNVVVVVFAMPGCGACEEYLPRMYSAIEYYQKLGHPFVVYDLGMKLKPGQIPVCVYDSTSTDPGVQQLADQHKISGLPTTLVLVRHGRNGRWEGGIDNETLVGALNSACTSNR